jgi:hypothetical protein
MDRREGYDYKFRDIIRRFPQYPERILVKDMNDEQESAPGFGGGSGTNAGVNIRLVKEETGEEVKNAGSGEGN